MEPGRETMGVGGEPLGLLGPGGVRHDLGQADDLAREGGVGRVAEQAVDRRGRPEADLGRLAEDRGDPGVGVLDVVDRVLGRLALGELDVEVDVKVRAARPERPAGGVDADLGQELIEGDERPGSLAHRDLDAIPDEADPAGQRHPDPVAVVAHRLGCVPDPSDGPVMVRAPDVDELVEAAAELLEDIADVSREVGRLAVRAEDDAVLVIAEGSRPEPQRAILLIEVTA
jgi:hypothetical protein